jgi:hypothetical protein
MFCCACYYGSTQITAWTSGIWICNVLVKLEITKKQILTYFWCDRGQTVSAGCNLNILIHSLQRLVGYFTPLSVFWQAYVWRRMVRRLMNGDSERIWMEAIISYPNYFCILPERLRETTTNLSQVILFEVRNEHPLNKIWSITPSPMWCVHYYRLRILSAILFLVIYYYLRNLIGSEYNFKEVWGIMFSSDIGWVNF